MGCVASCLPCLLYCTLEALQFARQHIHVPVELAYEPCEAVAFWNARPAGNVSVATTPVEDAGPRAETVTA